jgi:hypothetical protein
MQHKSDQVSRVSKVPNRPTAFQLYEKQVVTNIHFVVRFGFEVSNERSKPARIWLKFGLGSLRRHSRRAPRGNSSAGPGASARRGPRGSKAAGTGRLIISTIQSFVASEIVVSPERS